MENQPNRIFLDAGGDELGYISVSIILARIKELKDKNSQCTIINDETLENFNLRNVAINELENLIK